MAYISVRESCLFQTQIRGKFGLKQILQAVRFREFSDVLNIYRSHPLWRGVEEEGWLIVVRNPIGGEHDFIKRLKGVIVE
ncbi:MAG: hypothetical protein FJ012_00145 [Chloroflexi bacterium]|nr:hypothetical protein [Chloroflexota bacterium]